MREKLFKKGFVKRLFCVTLALALLATIMPQENTNVYADAGWNLNLATATMTDITLDDDNFTFNADVIDSIFDQSSYSKVDNDFIIYAKNGSKYKYAWNYGGWSDPNYEEELSTIKSYIGKLVEEVPLQ